MRSANGRPIPREEAGFALIEVLISAVIIVLASGATFGLLSASAHSSAEERHRSEAFGLAQEDQARLRALPISSLNRLNETRTVTLNGNPFTIESEGEYINNKTGTSSCGQGTSSADYIQITSTVTWRSLGSRKPAEIQSIVAPPPGSLNPENGTLTISADNAAEAPISGIGLSGTGAGTFSGTTDSEGCAVFANQAAGNYTLTPSGVATGLVEQNGNPPGPQTVSVIAGSTSTVQLLYDRPGSIPIKFTAILGGILKESEADSAVVFNTGMTTAKTFGTIGTPKRELEAKPLFPFTSPDTVYAGSCEGDNPNPEDETNPPDAAALGERDHPARWAVPNRHGPAAGPQSECLERQRQLESRNSSEKRPRNRQRHQMPREADLHHRSVRHSPPPASPSHGALMKSAPTTAAEVRAISRRAPRLSKT